MKKIEGNIKKIILSERQMETRKRPRMTTTKQKVLSLLLGGLALGLTQSPRAYFKIIKEIGREWEDIDKRALSNAAHSLHKSKLVDIKKNKNGTTFLVLSEKGKQKALEYDIFNIKIKKLKNWDLRWRIVMFDIPERMKKVREALRMHLKSMGFFEFQKSVFVHPYPCREEFEYIVEFYNVRRHLRFILATEIDNELEIKKFFGLN